MQSNGAAAIPLSTPSPFLRLACDYSLALRQDEGKRQSELLNPVTRLQSLGETQGSGNRFAIPRGLLRWAKGTRPVSSGRNIVDVSYRPRDANRLVAGAEPFDVGSTMIALPPGSAPAASRPSPRLPSTGKFGRSSGLASARKAFVRRVDLTRRITPSTSPSRRFNSSLRASACESCGAVSASTPYRHPGPATNASQDL